MTHDRLDVQRNSDTDFIVIAIERAAYYSKLPADHLLKTGDLIATVRLDQLEEAGVEIEYFTRTLAEFKKRW